MPKSAKISPEVPDAVLRLLCPALPGGGARGAGELGMDPRLGLLFAPGVDMMIFGTNPDLGPAVAALVSSKSSSSSKLAKLGCDEPCVCPPWVDAAAGAAARGAGGVWCVRPEWGADRAFSLKPPLDEEFEFQSGAVARGMLPPRAWSDDMPPYLFWLAMALSRTSAMAVGSLRSCGEEEAGGGPSGQRDSRDVVGGPKNGMRGRGVAVAGVPRGLGGDLAVECRVYTWL